MAAAAVPLPGPAVVASTAPAALGFPAGPSTPPAASPSGAEEDVEPADAAETDLFMSFAMQQLQEKEAEEDDMVFAKYLDGADVVEVAPAGEWAKVSASPPSH